MDQVGAVPLIYGGVRTLKSVLRDRSACERSVCVGTNRDSQVLLRWRRVRGAQRGEASNVEAVEPVEPDSIGVPIVSSTGGEAAGNDWRWII